MTPVFSEMSSRTHNYIDILETRFITSCDTQSVFKDYAYRYTYCMYIYTTDAYAYMKIKNKNYRAILENNGLTC